MHNWTKLILVFAILLVLAACGGDGLGTSGSPVDTPDPDPDPSNPATSIRLLVSTTELPSDDSSPVTLTVLAKDSDNNVVEGAEIVFSVDNDGAIKADNPISDGNGNVTATLSASGIPTNRILIVTATDSNTGQSSSLQVNVVGTTFSFSGDTVIEVGETTELTIALLDSGGKGISGKPVTVSSSAGNILSATIFTTDGSGVIRLSVTGEVAAVDTIEVSAMAATNNTVALTVVPVGTTSFAFEVPVVNTEVDLLVDQSVSVLLKDNNTGVAGEEISLAVTRGVFASTGQSFAVLTTDVNGRVIDTISSVGAGPSLMTAEVVTAGAFIGQTTSLALEFVATTASTLTLQAEPAVVQEGELTAVGATVRDVNGNLVKNKTVSFSIVGVDPTGGSLFPASGVTNSFGQVRSAYTAGDVNSGKDDVQLSALVQDAPTVTDTTNVTVTSGALHVALGTGNSIENYSDTTYKKDYVATVTSSSGGSVANQEVTITLWSYRYKKGFMTHRFDAGSCVGWVALEMFTCPNEDMNRNGIFDASIDNDVNNNGVLDPGNIATLAASGDSIVVTTDDNGIGEFSILYPENYAYWLEVEMEARVGVSGTEDFTRTRTLLPGLSTDYNDCDVDPPGSTSPFGRGLTEQAVPQDCTVDER